MKILIDIGHPAHVHYFKNFCKTSEAGGNEVLFTTRDKEIAIALLEHYGFKYINFGKPFKSKLGKIIGLFYFTIRLFGVSIKFKPDIYLNSTMYSAIVACLLRKPHIALEDTYNNEQVNLYLPFTSAVLTADYPHPSLGRKEIQYSGYHELLYLHPNNFVPDPGIIKELGLKEAEKYVILRFVSWNASHDFGHKGISQKNKLLAINRFSEFSKVFISSESTLPEEFNKYQFPLAPYKMHDALAFASLVYGESSTMTSEGAVLGIPGIYINDNSTYLTQEQENKYGLVFNYTETNADQIKSIEKGVEIICDFDSAEKWKVKRNRMLKDKIDSNAFITWFIENFPNSFKTMQENPEYQYKFENKI